MFKLNGWNERATLTCKSNAIELFSIGKEGEMTTKY